MMDGPNPTCFARGLGELGLIRRAIREEWGITPDTLRRSGPTINALLDGDERCKIAALRTLVLIERLGVDEEKTQLLRDLSARLDAAEALDAAR